MIEKARELRRKATKLVLFVSHTFLLCGACLGLAARSMTDLREKNYQLLMENSNMRQQLKGPVPSSIAIDVFNILKKYELSRGGRVEKWSLAVDPENSFLLTTWKSSKVWTGSCFATLSFEPLKFTEKPVCN